MISVEGVTKQFLTGKDAFWALNGIDLDIADGEFVAICGKSGSGKSTLLNIIGTLDKATSGTVTIDGVNISLLPPKKIAMLRNLQIGFVFQSFYLEPGYSVYDNVELPLVLAGETGIANRNKIEVALESVGLLHKIKSRAGTLSGGEQQRVAIARAIINNPRYIFADEPCGNLDTANSENIINILKELHSTGKTVVMVTHDEGDAQKANRIVTMSDGKVVGDCRTTAKRREAI